MEAWLHGCMVTWLHTDCMEAWLYGCMEAWLLGCMGYGCRRAKKKLRNESFILTPHFLMEISQIEKLREEWPKRCRSCRVRPDGSGLLHPAEDVRLRNVGELEFVAELHQLPGGYGLLEPEVEPADTN